MKLSNRLLLLPVLALFAWAGCSTENLSTTCRNDLPRIDRMFARASESLMGLDREPASTSIDSRDRDSWGEWAVDRLVELEHEIDIVEAAPGDHEALKQSLSRMATLLVVFHGHVTHGDFSQMVEDLHQIQEESWTHPSACFQPRVSMIRPGNARKKRLPTL